MGLFVSVVAVGNFWLNFEVPIWNFLLNFEIPWQYSTLKVVMVSDYFQMTMALEVRDHYEMTGRTQSLVPSEMKKKIHCIF